MTLLLITLIAVDLVLLPVAAWLIWRRPLSNTGRVKIVYVCAAVIAVVVAAFGITADSASAVFVHLLGAIFGASAMVIGGLWNAWLTERSHSLLQRKAAASSEFEATVRANPILGKLHKTKSGRGESVNEER